MYAIQPSILKNLWNIMINKLILLTCFLFLILFSGCGQVNDKKPKTLAEIKKEIQPSKYLTFSNKDFGVSFIYPDNWTSVPVSGPKTLFALSSLPKGATMTFGCQDYTKLGNYEEMAGKWNNIDYTMGKQEKLFANNYKDYKLFSYKKLTLNGANAAKAYFKGVPKNGKELNGMRVVVVKNGVKCDLIYVAYVSKFNELYDISSYDLFKGIAEKSLLSVTLK
jgi:hypothetical protein